MQLLVGANSYESVVRTSAELNNAAIEHVNSELNRKFTRYQPWMSNSENLEILQNLHLPDTQWAEAQAIPSDGTLRMLSKWLSIDHEPIGRIRNGTSFRILTEADIELVPFRKLFSDIINFNKLHCPNFSRKFSAIVTQIIPITSGNPDIVSTRDDGSGFSNHKYRGGVFLSLPRRKDYASFEGALNLAHELGHQTLMMYQCGDNILTGDLDTPKYSVIRKTFRPAILSFHAVVATAFMIEWYLEARDSLSGLVDLTYSNNRIRELANGLSVGIAMFSPSELTPLGRLMLEELSALYGAISK